jgi:uncharacterized protein YdeI (YjbR/CyaY-like superfamily)
MSTIHPNATKEIDRAFDKFTGFQKEYCNHLRALIHKALPDVKEDWKWGPNFNVNGMVCGVWAFKKHVKINFFKGSLMSDKYNLFTDEENDKGNRSIDFTEHSLIDDDKLAEYLQEAAALNKQGVKVEKKSSVVDIPVELQRALNVNKGLKMYFDKMAPSHKREYASYINDAAQAETKERRVKKVIEMIIENRKMKEKMELKNKYRKR